VIDASEAPLPANVAIALEGDDERQTSATASVAPRRGPTGGARRKRDG
jgi:hypothetical protein